MSGALWTATLPTLAGMAMLLLGLLLPTRVRLDQATRLAAWQGGLLALAAAAAAWNGAVLLWPLAAVALSGRAVLLPALVRRATGGAASGRPPARSVVGSLLAGTVLAVLAVAAVVPPGAGDGVAGMREGAGVALAVLLAGMLASAARRGLGFGLIGLLAAENGALLGLVEAGAAGVPLPVAASLAVLSPGLLAAAALAARRGGGRWRLAAEGR